MHRSSSRFSFSEPSGTVLSNIVPRSRSPPEGAADGSGSGRTGLAGAVYTLLIGGLGVIGHLATIDNKIVGHLVSME